MRLTLWYAAFFTGSVLFAFTGFGFILARGIHHVDLSPRSLHELLEAYSRYFGVSLGIAALGSIGLGWLLARRSLSGVGDVQQAAQSIAKGNFGSRVPVKGTGDEVDRLAVTFNDMIRQIEAVLKSMKEITDNIAHDLRSPITRMRGMAELTLTGSPSAQDYAMAVGGVIEECDRLLGMINTMLAISEAEAGVAKLKVKTVDMAQLLRDVGELFQPVAEDRMIRLTVEVAGRLPVHGDVQKLQRAMANLVDNALKYTRPGGGVHLSAEQSAAGVIIRIRDTGIGISGEDLPRIFERFVRCDHSRSEPGSGLGLSLAKAFVGAHGGTISVESTLGVGTEFVVMVPAQTP